jgi:hypothetical protein
VWVQLRVVGTTDRQLPVAVDGGVNVAVDVCWTPPAVESYQ